jgi:hypothetical protein
VISRADMAARGVPRTTVNGWYRHRARTGHPEKAGRIGRTDYWYDDEWTAWHDRHLRGLDYFPGPDAYGTTSKGRRAPLWKRHIQDDTRAKGGSP